MHPNSEPTSTDAAGHAAPRSNALRHGLTARNVLPAALEERIASIRCQLENDVALASAIERILVDELARHAAMLEFAATAEIVALRVGCVSVSNFIGDVGDESSSISDLQLTTTISSEAAARVTRYRRAHERGLHRAIACLREIRTSHTTVCCEDRPAPESPFDSEEACADFLRERMLSDAWRCPRCGCGSGSWLQRQQRWECSDCKYQAGLRVGKVMHRSPLPLRTWFAAIRRFLADAEITPQELAEELGLPRWATARNILRRIRAAAASADADVQLAGLLSFSTLPRPPTTAGDAATTLAVRREHAMKERHMKTNAQDKPTK